MACVQHTLHTYFNIIADKCYHIFWLDTIHHAYSSSDVAEIGGAERRIS
jgi:hypothetical protein